MGMLLRRLLGAVLLYLSVAPFSPEASACIYSRPAFDYGPGPSAWLSYQCDEGFPWYDYSNFMPTYGAGSGVRGSGASGSPVAEAQADADFEGDPDCNAQKASPKTNMPVVIATGNKVKREEDFRANGEAPLELVRTYSKAPVRQGVFGKNWISSFDYELGFERGSKACIQYVGHRGCSLEDADQIYRYGPESARHSYDKLTGSGLPGYRLKGKPDYPAYIIQEGASFAYYDEEGGKEIYGMGGQILSTRDRYGIGWTFTYDSAFRLQRVTHTSGRYINVSIGASNKVSIVTDPSGQIYTYSYDANGYLSGVTYPGGSTRTYHYETAGMPDALTGISVNGVRYSQYSYYSGGRVRTSGLVNGIEQSGPASLS